MAALNWNKSEAEKLESWLLPLTREEFDEWWKEWGERHGVGAVPENEDEEPSCDFCGDQWPCATSRIRETMNSLGLNYDYSRN